MFLNRSLPLAFLFSATLLTGCGSTAQKPLNLYEWNGYQPAVYHHFKKGQSAPEEQMASLEKLIAESTAKNRPVAPGVHAHLGMLYADSGRQTDAKTQFEREKELFPESGRFMTFLIGNMERKDK